MKRTLCQFVRFQNRLMRLAVVEEAEGMPLRVFPMVGELHSTEFFNGVMALVDAGAEIPAGVRADQLHEMLKRMPEPAPGQNYRIAKIPFIK